MDNSQHIVSSNKKRKRGRPRKAEVVGTSNMTSPHILLGQKGPIGRPKKSQGVETSSTTSQPNEGVGVSNSKSELIPPPQKRPVGRPRKVHTNSISDGETIVRGPSRPLIMKTTTLCHDTYIEPNGNLRPLVPRLPSLSYSNIFDVPSSSQQTKKFGHSSVSTGNSMSGLTSKHANNKHVNSLNSKELNNSESYEGYIVDSDNDDNLSNIEDSTDNNTVTTVATQDFPSEYLSLGPPRYKCMCCHSIMWKEERNNKSSSSSSIPTFSICCADGQIKLPEVRQPPPYLGQLLFGGSKWRHFHDRIKVYNSMFAYSSLGGKVDKLINVHGGGPFCYRQGGQNHHQMGTLMPTEGQKPRFCQLYFYDTDNEVNNRISAIQTNKSKDAKDRPKPEIVQNLINMFDEVSPLAKKFRQARDRFKEGEPPELKILLKESSSASGRPNHITPSSEIAVFIVGENDPNIGDRDVILHLKHGGLERISFIHPLFMALQYPILFPRAEDGFHTGIRYIRTASNTGKKLLVYFASDVFEGVETTLNQNTTSSSKINAMVQDPPLNVDVVTKDMQPPSTKRTRNNDDGHNKKKKT